MRIMLTQLYVSREPRTPIALMDLASYGRSYGHTVDVEYFDRLDSLRDYNVIGFSSIAYNTIVLSSLLKLRSTFSGRIILGGKVTKVLSDDNRASLEARGIDVYDKPGESLFSDDKITYSTYPIWSVADFKKLDRCGMMCEVMSSRGCPYSCNFCQNTEPKVVWFSQDRTIQNIKMILGDVGRHQVFLCDDLFASGPTRMIRLYNEASHQGLQLRNKTKFFLHVQHTGDDMLEALKIYDPLETQLGIEHGNDLMLKAMGKTFTADLAQSRLRSLHRSGVRVSCLFVMGYPGETRKSLQDLVEFVDRNRRYMSGVWVSYYQPVPYTKGWNVAKERVGGLLSSGGWNYDINYLDPNITRHDLEKARWAVMKH